MNNIKDFTTASSSYRSPILQLYQRMTLDINLHVHFFTNTTIAGMTFDYFT